MDCSFPRFHDASVNPRYLIYSGSQCKPITQASRPTTEYTYEIYLLLHLLFITQLIKTQDAKIDRIINDIYGLLVCLLP